MCIRDSVITISVSASENIQTPTVTIAGNAAAIASGSNGERVYTATYMMQSSDNTGVIPFTVDFSDMANNDGTQVTAVANDADGNVTFDKQAPSFTAVTIASNNSNDATLAVVNDVITVTLTSDEAIKTGADPTVTINGNTATVRFWERGAQTQFVLGKIFPMIGPNENSGVFFQGALGFMYHKIRIEDIGNNSPQLSADMLKGYDRLCMGLTTSQCVGYRYFSNNHKINFFVGIEFIQAFTQDVRMYDYNSQTSYEDNRFDLLSGLKFGWTIPLYKKSDNQYYYY